jgi:hypothetical protein
MQDQPPAKDMGVQIWGMQKNLSSKLRQLFDLSRATPRAETTQLLPVVAETAGPLGVDQLGVPVENPMRSYVGHCLILGASGSGKTSLIQHLLADLDCQVVWLSDAGLDTSVLSGAIAQQQRFEFPVLLVADDAHLFAEQLELLEQVARDGRRANILLLVSAQLLADLPQAIWRNCQIKFALDSDSRMQLKLVSHEQLGPYVAVFSWPGRQGFIRIVSPAKLGSPLKDQGNPLLRRASRLPSTPYEESALARQIPLDQWSVEELAEPQGLRDRQLGNTDQPRRTRYSRTL